MEEKDKPQKLVTIIFQTTSACNLRCSYCYCQADVNNSHKLSFDSFKKCVLKVDNFFEDNYEICFLFHGGEPLVLGKRFYSDAFGFLKHRMKHTYHTGIQTNLILLDKRFLELFQANNCTISTSLDGYQQPNDLYRKYRNGRGTYVSVSDKIRLLLQQGVELGIVSVINPGNVGSPADFYNFTKEYPNVLFGLSPMFLAREGHIFAPDSKDLGHFLVSLFNLWVNDITPPRISFFEDIIGKLVTGNTSTVCTFHHDCSESFFAIDGVGDVYPCCHFVGNKLFCYGNLIQSSFNNIYNSSRRRQISDRAFRSDNPCQACDLFQMCFSGCMATSENGIHSKDYFCEAYKMIFTHVKDYLEVCLSDRPRDIYAHEANTAREQARMS